jgi:uncharacterized protein
MDLEMLDGYLAAVLASPRPIAVADWLPGVWSAHGDEASFGSGSQMQRAIRLVLGYYNELVDTIGGEEPWEPFCYAAAEGDTLAIGEEWIDGFTQGLDLWAEDWEEGLPEGEGDAVREELDRMMAPWLDEAAGDADDETRLTWMEEAATTVEALRARWAALGLPAPQPVAADEPAAPRAGGPGRNDPCPCGSGKKYKKCCGALAS